VGVPEKPMVFPKFVTCLTGPPGEIVLPGQGPRVDWEAELVSVIGKLAYKDPDRAGPASQCWPDRRPVPVRANNPDAGVPAANQPGQIPPRIRPHGTVASHRRRIRQSRQPGIGLHHSMAKRCSTPEPPSSWSQYQR
jgi:hypothetical protein